MLFLGPNLLSEHTLQRTAIQSGRGGMAAIGPTFAETVVGPDPGLTGGFGLLGQHVVGRMLAGHNLIGNRAGQMAVLGGGDVETASVVLTIRANTSLTVTKKGRLGGLIGEFSLVGREVIGRLFPWQTGLHVTRGGTRYAILGPVPGTDTSGTQVTLDWVQHAQPFVWVAASPPNLLTMDWAKDGQPFVSNDVNVEVVSGCNLVIRCNASLTRPDEVSSAATLTITADASLTWPDVVTTSVTLPIEATCSLDNPLFETSSVTLPIQATVEMTWPALEFASLTLPIEATVSTTRTTVVTAGLDLYIHADVANAGVVTSFASQTFPIRAAVTISGVGTRKVKPCELPTGVLQLTSNLPFGVWQEQPHAIFTWRMGFVCQREPGDDPAAVDGYLVVLDHSPTTAPWWDAEHRVVTNKDYALDTVPPYGAGSYWFHVSACNSVGIGEPAHYNVRYNVRPGRPGEGFMRINGLDTLAQAPLVRYAPPTPHVLTWSLATDANANDVASYNLQIATSHTFGLNPESGSSEIVLDAETDETGSFPLVEPLSPGLFFWRTRAFDGHEYGEWSPVGSFRVNHPPEAPDNLRVYQTG